MIKIVFFIPLILFKFNFISISILFCNNTEKRLGSKITFLNKDTPLYNLIFSKHVGRPLKCIKFKKKIISFKRFL